MEELKKALETAFTAVSSISVQGDDVERMAIARENLRNAYRFVKEKSEEKKGAVKTGNG